MIEVKFTGANLDTLRRQITHFLDEMDGPGPTVTEVMTEEDPPYPEYKTIKQQLDIESEKLKVAEAEVTSLSRAWERLQKVEEPVAEPVEEPVTGPFPVAAAKDAAPSTASPAADTSGATSAEAPSDAPDYAILREAVLRLAVVKTPETTRAVLDRYGVRRAADLDPSRWNDLLADVNAAMKE